jgi:hypothetical protein
MNLGALRGVQNQCETLFNKIAFDELKDSQSYPKWDYLNNVRRVFENADLDHYLNSDVNMITFKKFFGEYVCEVLFCVEQSL